jgi:hypothetical protein
MESNAKVVQERNGAKATSRREKIENTNANSTNNGIDNAKQRKRSSKQKKKICPKPGETATTMR